MDLLRLTNKLSQTQFSAQTSILRKSIRDTPALLRVLMKLFLKRQRYCFQFFKYFVLFPGSSQMSQTLSIDTYDRLIFGDDAIHAMIKIYECKEMQNKIWAFLNIKALKYLQKCLAFSNKMEKLYVEKLQKPVKHDAFKMIKQYDISVDIQIIKNRQRAISRQKKRDQQTTTTHRQNLKTNHQLYEVKIQGKNYLNSRIMIHSSFNGEENLKSVEHISKIIEQGSLSQSKHILEETHSQNNIPSHIELKSMSEHSDKRNETRFQTKQQIRSQTKIRFTYTSPTKDQIGENFKRQKSPTKKIVDQEKRKDNLGRYKWILPKGLDQKHLCCQNFCGMKCSEH